MSAHKTVLSGVKVLDLSRVLSGPCCTQTLGDLGADVVKIERPPLGDDARTYGASLGASLGSSSGGSLDADAQDGPPQTTFYAACNRNKRSVALDFSQPEHQALLRRMAQQADVLVENFKAGTLARFQLDYESLKASNPRLIYCSITGFGQTGPYASRPAYDFIMQGMSGLMSTCGEAAMPMRTAVPITDLIAGNNATTAILAALIQRGQTGEGQFIDCAMLDVAVNFNSHVAQTYLATGSVPERVGNSNPIIAPSELFKTSDGWLILSVANEAQFKTLCGLVPDLVADPRFGSNWDRVAHRPALHAVIEAVTRTHGTRHWVDLFAGAGLPAGPIHSLEDVFNDPQVQHRQLLVEVDGLAGQRLPLLRSPLNMSAVEIPYRAPPRMGQHTQEVLAEWLAEGAGA